LERWLVEYGRGGQAKIAREAQLGADVVSRIANGSQPSLATAAAIERVTGVPATWYTEPADAPETEAPTGTDAA